MKIQIEQHEIEAAVREYMAAQGIKVEGKTLTVEFKMTRVDGGGLIANLNIDEANNPTPTAAAPTKAAPKPRANTVGSAVAAQADKVTGTVNKLPTAAEAIADAQARAAAETKPEVTIQAAEPTEAVQGGEAEAAPAEAKPATTSSLFG